MKDKDLIRPYVADGIEEYENPMPRWWVGLFYATILFGALYLLRYHVGGGPSLEQSHAADVAVDTALRTAAASAGQAEGGADLGQRLASPEVIAQGKDVFAVNCVPCHGAKAEGTIGPNLTDDFWLNGGRGEQIILTISKGAVEKGMPPWGGILGDRKVEQLAAFILSLRGSNPPNAKAPQGEPLEKSPP